MSLAVNSLKFSRDDVVLFDNLSFTVKEGQLVHIQGGNGKGKTTLLKILAGIFQPQAGTKTPLLNTQFCYIGHKSAVNKQMSVEENLAFLLQGYKNKCSLLDALESFNMQAYAQMQAGFLSAGQQRRVALSKLAAIDTQYWFLDEPYTSLDSKGIEQVNNLIKQHLQEQGIVIMTSHQTINIDNINKVDVVL